MSSREPCPQCGEAALAPDIATNSGNLTCNKCGTVVYENPIVSEVSFGETASGGAVVQGTMMGVDQARVALPGRQNTMDSREQTLATGKRNIKDLAASMNIPDFISDSAYMWFRLALNNNFVQGRRSQNVTAACLYIACRKERTEHLLIDFSSRLQISVFSLGATFLKMVRTLNIIKLPLADPSLFISHFAERMNFDRERPNATNIVINDALSLAARMAQDSMVEGRRPAGIAGACVLLAARMNGFRRSHAEVVAIAHVSEDTIQLRLDEFKKTKAADLKIKDFRQKGLEAETTKPPSYLRNQVQDGKKLLKTQSRLKDLKSTLAFVRNTPNDELKRKLESSSGDSAAQVKKSRRLDTLGGRLLAPRTRTLRLRATGLETVNKNDKEEGQNTNESSDKDQSVEEVASDEVNPEEIVSETESEPQSESESSIPRLNSLDVDVPTLLKEIHSLGFNPRFFAEEIQSIEKVIDNKYVNQETQQRESSPDEEFDVNKPRDLVKKCKPTQHYLDLVPSDETLDDVEFTKEEEAYIFSDDKLFEAKRAAWLTMYQDYLLDQERKRLKMETDEITGNTSGNKKKRRTKVTEESDVDMQNFGLDEAIAQSGEKKGGLDGIKTILSKRPLSKKINYKNLNTERLFGPANTSAS